MKFKNDFRAISEDKQKFRKNYMRMQIPEIVPLTVQGTKKNEKKNVAV